MYRLHIIPRLAVSRRFAKTQSQGFGRAREGRRKPMREFDEMSQNAQYNMYEQFVSFAEKEIFNRISETTSQQQRLFTRQRNTLTNCTKNGLVEIG